MATTNVTPISDDVSSTPPPRRRRWLRRTVVVLLILGGLFLVLLGITALATLGVRNDLAAGRKAMQEGRQAVAFGQLDAAADDFEQASEHFADASGAADGGLAGLAGAIPVLGRNIDVAQGVAEAGTELADAGTQLVDAVNTLPDGLGSLAPQDGSLPIDAISSLGDEVVAAEDHARAALRRVRDTPSSLLAGPVADARFEAERQVEQAADAITALRLTLQGLPDFAGANGERTYFFVAESPAEQRGTGGIWGAYSIVTANDGKFEFSKFAPIQQLPDLDPDTLPPPNPDYARNYDQYGGAGFWRNMNMTPDFPSASRAVLNAYEAHTGERLDGVMSADPFALQELLAVTGPTTVPGLDRQIDADTVVPFTTNEAYIRFRESRERKEVLGDVAKGVFERFLGMEEHNIGRLRAVSSAVAGGHLKVYTDTDSSLEDALVLAGADGGLRASEPGDVSAVIVNSGSGSKVDYYANREVDYDVQLGGSGEAIATTEGRGSATMRRPRGSRIRDQAARRRRPRRQHRPRDHVMRAGLRSADRRTQRHPDRRSALRLGAGHPLVPGLLHDPGRNDGLAAHADQAGRRMGRQLLGGHVSPDVPQPDDGAAHPGADRDPRAVGSAHHLDQHGHGDRRRDRRVGGNPRATHRVGGPLRRPGPAAVVEGPGPAARRLASQPRSAVRRWAARRRPGMRTPRSMTGVLRSGGMSAVCGLRLPSRSGAEPRTTQPHRATRGRRPRSRRWRCSHP